MLHFDGENQYGRSMIEMLAVLAIIGILAIGGMYGYKIAVAKHKANEVAQEVFIAKQEMEIAATRHLQHKLNVDLPENSLVSLVGTEERPNAGIRVDFGNDVTACKQFMLMFKDNPDFAISNKCEED